MKVARPSTTPRSRACAHPVVGRSALRAVRKDFSQDRNATPSTRLVLPWPLPPSRSRYIPRRIPSSAPAGYYEFSVLLAFSNGDQGDRREGDHANEQNQKVEKSEGRS